MKLPQSPTTPSKQLTAFSLLIACEEKLQQPFIYLRWIILLMYKSNNLYRVFNNFVLNWCRLSQINTIRISSWGNNYLKSLQFQSPKMALNYLDTPLYSIIMHSVGSQIRRDIGIKHLFYLPHRKALNLPETSFFLIPDYTIRGEWIHQTV